MKTSISEYEEAELKQELFNLAVIIVKLISIVCIVVAYATSVVYLLY